MASQLHCSLEKAPASRPHRVCSIVPPHLLADILRHDGHTEPTRAAVHNTLRHLYKLQECRKARIENAHALFSSPTTEVPSAVETAVHRSIYDSKKTNRKRKALVFEEGGDTAAFVADKNAKEVFEHFGNAHKFFSEVFGRNSIDDKGLHLIASVHYDDTPGPPGMDNAFWDGDEMAFGDGDGEVFGSFTRNIDIIGHELTHGVVQHEADLEYEFQSGALNESLADVFGTMIKQYFHPNGKQLAKDADWLIGEGIFQPSITNAQALRSMKAPGTAYDNPKIGKDQSCPTPAPAIGEGCTATLESPIVPSIFVATALGGYSWDRAGQIWYAALRDPELKGIDTKTAFNVFADLTTKYALNMYNEEVRAVVKDAWIKVKVHGTAAMDDIVIPRAHL